MKEIDIMGTTTEFANKEQVVEVKTEEKFVTFLIKDQIYAIDVLRVKEVLFSLKITEVSKGLSFLRGVFDLRGKIIPLVDARLLLNKPEKEYDENTVFLILEFGELYVGIIVDTVLDVAGFTFNQESVDTEDEKADYIKEIRKKDEDLVIVLEIDKLFNQEELYKIEQLTKSKK